MLCLPSLNSIGAHMEAVGRAFSMPAGGDKYWRMVEHSRGLAILAAYIPSSRAARRLRRDFEKGRPMRRILMALEIALCESSPPTSLQRPKSSTGVLVMFSRQNADHDGAAPMSGLQSSRGYERSVN